MSKSVIPFINHTAAEVNSSACANAEFSSAECPRAFGTLAGAFMCAGGRQ